MSQYTLLTPELRYQISTFWKAVFYGVNLFACAEEGTEIGC